MQFSEISVGKIFQCGGKHYIKTEPIVGYLADQEIEFNARELDTQKFRQINYYSSVISDESRELFEKLWEHKAGAAIDKKLCFDFFLEGINAIQRS